MFEIFCRKLYILQVTELIDSKFFLFFYRWYLLSGMESNLMISGPRIRQLASVLAIEAVTPDDGKFLMFLYEIC